MDFTGKCIKILPAVSGTSARNGEQWVKNSFVIECEGQYPKKCVFTVFGEDKWKNFGIVEGGMYQVSFDIDAREWNGKWFNEVRAWNVVGVGSNNPTHNAAPAPPQTQNAEASQAQGDGDGLPF